MTPLRTLGLAGLLATLALVCGCGDDAAPLPVGHILVRVTAPRTTVHPGEGVPLTVTRVWRADHEPSPFDEAMLEPLVLRDERVARRRADGRVEETRRYRAYVFRLEDVRVPALVFASRPRDGGAIALARSEPVDFTVRPEVDPERPGPPELPGLAPRRPPAPWTWGLVLLVLVAVLEGVAWRARQRARRAAHEAAAAPLRALAALRARGATTPEACRADLEEALRLVRGWLAREAGVPAHARTTEEVAAALPDPSAWLALAARADRVRFGRAALAPEALADALAAAARVVAGAEEAA